MLTFPLLILLSSMSLADMSPESLNNVLLFDQKVDHFAYSPNPMTFKQRYYYNATYATQSNNPIFFYCGAEGPMDHALKSSGFLFYLAEAFNATVLFAEHRYYGKSLPFADSFSQPNIQFLSVEQALADYAELLLEFKKSPNYTDSPIIAFGGSYGGMLSAYMRSTYPNLINGAISSSGPVNMCAGIGNPHNFFKAVTKAFKDAKPDCAKNIKSAFESVEQLATTGPEGLKEVSTKLGLCSNLTSTAELDWALRWLRNAFVFTAMYNYPDFTSRSNPAQTNLVANPVLATCDAFLAQKDPIEGLQAAAKIFYGQAECHDFKTEYIECADVTGCGLGNDSKAWDFQCCTEINLYDPSGSTADDMFPSLPLTKDRVTSECKKRWGVVPVYNQLSIEYGEKSWKYRSNILFSNGDLDPWKTGGITSDQSESVKVVDIKGGAHCFDLRKPDKHDPPSAREARQLESNYIGEWIKKRFRNEA